LEENDENENGNENTISVATRITISLKGIEWAMLNSCNRV
jgi:hypothetical protein